MRLWGRQFLDMLQNLLSNGYLPEEIPTPFRTKGLGNLVATSSELLAIDPERWGQLTLHSIARTGKLRRRLQFPNPANYARLAKEISDGWATAIEPHIASSAISLSAPSIDSKSGRLKPSTHWRELPQHRSRIRATSKYVLIADVSRCYESIYTHSIPWALHTKPVAKARMRDLTLLGNRIDKRARECQQGQTIGIPIGPDTSLILSEIVLSSLDATIVSEIGGNGYRLVDDYEFGFLTLAEAENGLNVLQEILYSLQLNLNTTKTRILELPAPISALWAARLSAYHLRNERSPTKTELIQFFDLAFEQAKEWPDESVLKYALSIVGRLEDRSIWSTTEDLLLQCMMVEPASISHVLKILIDRKLKDFTLDTSRISQVLNHIIDRHVSAGNTGEVAAALWASIVLKTEINAVSALKLSKSEDSIVALLALQADSERLVHGGLDKTYWEASIGIDGMWEDRWLLLYEGVSRGWLDAGSWMPNQDPLYKYLANNNVSFFSSNVIERERHTPPVFETPRPEFVSAGASSLPLM
jgi:hypothetical protein